MQNKILKFGIVGTNFISDAFADAVKLSKKCEAAAIFSRSKEKGRLFAKKHGISKVYESLDAMLADGSLDAVYIASPTFLHKEMAVKTLLSQKSALVEKMIAVNSREFSEIEKAKEASSGIFLEAMRPDFDKAFLMVEKNLAKLGKIVEADFEFCQYSSRYDNFKRGIVENAFNPELKNSALSDIGIYPLHLAIRLFGEAKKITSESHFLENGFESDGKLILEYEDFNVNIRYSKIFEGENLSYIRGERGVITFGKINAPKKLSIIIDGKETIENFTSEKNNILTEVDAFCDSVLGDGKYLRFIDVTRKTMNAVDEIYKSSGIIFD